MLTIFSIPKALYGHFAIIQRNAIQSWLKLRPACEVILFGHDEGVAEVAAEFGIRHVPYVNCTEYGTPLLNSVFEIAQRIASYPLIAFVNADIILMSDFLPAVQRVKGHQFLLTGRRWQLDLDEPLNFENPEWEPTLRTMVTERGILGREYSIDYVLFPKGLVKEMLPFAVGRPGWDTWLIYRMRTLGIPVIDATRVLTAIHQNHDYSHIPGGDAKTYEGPEAKRNRILMGGGSHVFTLQDATWILTRYCQWPALTFGNLRRQLETLPIIFPQPGLWIRLYKIWLLLVVALGIWLPRLLPNRLALAVIRRLHALWLWVKDKVV